MALTYTGLGNPPGHGKNPKSPSELDLKSAEGIKQAYISLKSKHETIPSDLITILHHVLDSYTVPILKALHASLFGDEWKSGLKADLVNKLSSEYISNVSNNRKAREDAVNAAILPIERKGESDRGELMNNARHDRQEVDISKNATTSSSAKGGDDDQQEKDDGKINNTSDGNEYSDANNGNITDGGKDGESTSDQSVGRSITKTLSNDYDLDLDGRTLYDTDEDDVNDVEEKKTRLHNADENKRTLAPPTTIRSMTASPKELEATRLKEIRTCRRVTMPMVRHLTAPPTKTRAMAAITTPQEQGKTTQKQTSTDSIAPLK